MPKVTATQKFVPIREIRDGIVVLKDNSLRAIIMVSSVNFSLKSEDERTATLMQFQNFLNSLDFSVQIVIQSRKLDIRPYISLLEEQYKVQTTDLMRLQVEEYIEFVKNFTEHVNIMTKHFYVVVPYSPAIIKTKRSGGVFSFLSSKNGTDQDKTEFEENRSQLEQRISMVDQGLTATGIRTARLKTEEEIELFYKTFNPDEESGPMRIEMNKNV